MNQNRPESHFTWGNTNELITKPDAKGLNITQYIHDWFYSYYNSESITVGEHIPLYMTSIE